MLSQLSSVFSKEASVPKNVVLHYSAKKCKAGYNSQKCPTSEDLSFARLQQKHPLHVDEGLVALGSWSLRFLKFR